MYLKKPHRLYFTGNYEGTLLLEKMLLYEKSMGHSKRASLRKERREV